ncbi:hypothetical protein SpCBS45565_g00163 [Spizellomyces sp. 'palustris']|nr:hypothetical protein SpCBS45565_g00163 [Spizellomyces sp. 'palustris']
MTQAAPDPDSYLSRLSSLSCPIDSPLVAAAPVAVAIDGSIHDVNLADSSIYAPDATAEKGLAQTVAYAVKEAGYLAKMNALLEEGQKLLASLYSYRSCSRAIPQVQSNEQANRLEIYQRTYEVLQPEVDKMQKFMSFRDAATAGVTDVLAEMVPEIRDRDFFPSADFLETCAQVLDMFVVMDAMKNIKGSMNNDFSMYRRAVQSANRNVSEDETIMQHKLYSFLANQDQYSSELKNSLSKLSSTHEDIITDMIENCADRIESGQYLLPKTKYMYYRAISFGLYLLDKEGEEHDITRRKKFKLDRFGKILKACPVVPLFADQYVSLSTIYSKAPHLSNTKWEEVEETGKANLARSYSLVNHIDVARAEYIEYVALFKRTINTLRPSDGTNAAIPQEHCATVYNIVLQGLKTLAQCTTAVLEQSAWKYANPINPQIARHIPNEALSYELAVRFNYSAEEKRALIEYIAMIKNLSSMLLSLDRAFLVAINHQIYMDVQDFARNHISDFFAHASKKKRPVAAIIKHLRDIAFDGPPLDDDAAGRGKKDTKSSGGDTYDSAPRAIPLAPSLLQIVRLILNSCFNEKAKGMKGGLMREKDFKDSQANEVQEFLTRSRMYLPMLDLEGTVRQLSDLSDLWFKEFYLELSKKVQFPISMSLPWILTEHILHSNDAEMMQFVFYPFELYNDAAYRTLYHLKSKFIYDEINAEVSLCFDQLIFKLSEKIFLHYKKAASCIVLAADLKTETDLAHMGLVLEAYDGILAQKNYQLLGRSLNMWEPIGQWMNHHLRKSIDTAICRYEGSDLTYITDLDTLLRSARMTHQLLSRRIILDKFDDMLAEVDESVSIAAVNGRIISHTLNQLVNDFIPNYCFNSALSVAFSAQNALLKEFIGEPHFKTVTRWTGKHGVPVIISELSKHIDTIVKNTMTAYIGVISKGTPQTMKLPLFEYGTAGTFEYFAAHLKPLITYPALKSDVLQAFREAGNTVLTVKFLEDVLAIDGPFQDIQPLDFVPQAPDSRATSYSKLRDFDEVFESHNYATPYRTWVERTDVLYVPSPPKALMSPFLEHLRGTLDSVAEEWQADGHLENPRAFFRIWSVLQFTFCVPSVGEGRLVRELFGEGLSWAGCTFIHLLNQSDVYTAFDFNNHCLSVQRADRKAAHLTFGFGQYGGVIGVTGANEKAPVTPDSASLSPTSATAATAIGLRQDVVQFLESASFYQNVNEEVFATLMGMEAVA